MLKIINRHIIYFFIIIIFLTTSCGENPTNNTIKNSGLISFQVSGSFFYNFDSKTVKIAEPDSTSKFLTLFGTKNETKGTTAIVVRLLIDNKTQKEYNIIGDNSITFSLYNGAESYKSINGKLIITKWNDNSFNATFNGRLEQSGNPTAIIYIQNGIIEINSSQ